MGGDNDEAGAITGMHLLGATLSKLGPGRHDDDV